MSERIVPGPVPDGGGIREAVCIHTKKIYDSCRDKDCIEDLRVYPTQASQAVLERAIGVRGGRAELLQAYLNVEPASYNRGFYSVDVRYYYRLTAEAFTAGGRPQEVCGLAVFDKRALLFGSEGNAKSFSSRDAVQALCGGRTNLPEAVVEVVDPIVLSLRLVDPCELPCCPPCNPCPPPPPGGGCCPPPPPPPAGGCCPENELTEIPGCISACFDSELTFESSSRRLTVTLGQFSIVRLERDSQLLIPMYDYCMPTRECCAGEEHREDDPCEIFRQIRFPVGEFFPPSTLPGMAEEEKGCRC